MLKLYAYNAGKGDCVRLEFGEENNSHNVVIDTGVTRFVQKFNEICNNLTSPDLLILTHVDDDHIGGVLALLRAGWKCPFKEVRMNRTGAVDKGNAYLSTRQNDEVYSRLVDQGIDVQPMFAGDSINLYSAMITAIWPEKIVDDNNRNDTPLAYHKDYGKALSFLADEPIRKIDRSINNRNSIVFIFEYDGHRLLFTGDAWGTDVINALSKDADDKQTFDLIKLPHHGAVGNISEDYPKYMETKKFLICTDGVMHPDKQTIAKLKKWYGDITIYSPSNWWKRGFFTDEDDKDGVNLIYSEGLVFEW